MCILHEFGEIYCKAFDTLVLSVKFIILIKLPWQQFDFAKDSDGKLPNLIGLKSMLVVRLADWCNAHNTIVLNNWDLMLKETTLISTVELKKGRKVKK